MYAIIKAGSRQYRVEKGQEIEFDYSEKAKPGEKVTFDEVLLVHDGKKSTVGTPTVSGAKVTGEVVEMVRAKKLRVFKYRRREGYHRALGHRQKYTLVKITDIKA